MKLERVMKIANAGSSVSFSPDSKYIATRLGHQVIVRECPSGKKVISLKYPSEVQSVVFDHTGRYIAVVIGEGKSEHSVLILEYPSGRKVLELKYPKEVMRVAFSPDGKYIAAGGFDNTAIVWEIPSGREVLKVRHDFWVLSVSFSPDGRYLVTGGADNTAMVWEFPSGKKVAKITHGFWVFSVAFSGNGEFLATGSANGTVAVWRVDLWKKIATFMAHPETWSVALSPSGKYLATGGSDGNVILWEMPAGKKIATEMLGGNINSITFSPDGKYLAAASQNKTLMVWSLIAEREGVEIPTELPMISGFSEQSQKRFETMERPEVRGSYVVLRGNSDSLESKKVLEVKRPMIVSSVALQGEYLAIGGLENSATLWNIRTGKKEREFPHGFWVFSVDFSQDGIYLATGSWDNTAAVWEVATGRKVAEFQHDSFVISVRFSGSGKYLATGCYSGSVLVWEISTGKKIAEFQHLAQVNAVDFSPDEKYIVAGCSDGLMVLWDIHSKKKVAEYHFPGNVTGVAFSPDGKRIAVASEKAIIIDIMSREARRLPEENVVAVAFSRDGTYLATGNDNTAVVWKIATGKKVAVFQHSDTVRSICFNEDNTLFATGSADNTAVVWKLSRSKLTKILSHKSDVVTVATEGDYLVSSCVDGTVTVWNMSSGEKIAELNNGFPASIIAFSPEREYLALAGIVNEATVWHIPSGKKITVPSPSLPDNVMVSRGGRFLVISSGYNTVIADIKSRRTQKIHVPWEISNIEFSESGKCVALLGERNAIVVDMFSGEKIIFRFSKEPIVTTGRNIIHFKFVKDVSIEGKRFRNPTSVFSGGTHAVVRTGNSLWYYHEKWKKIGIRGMTHDTVPPSNQVSWTMENGNFFIDRGDVLQFDGKIKFRATVATLSPDGNRWAAATGKYVIIDGKYCVETDFEVEKIGWGTAGIYLEGTGKRSGISIPSRPLECGKFRWTGKTRVSVTDVKLWLEMARAAGFENITGISCVQKVYAKFMKGKKITGPIWFFVGNLQIAHVQREYMKNTILVTRDINEIRESSKNRKFAKIVILVGTQPLPRTQQSIVVRNAKEALNVIFEIFAKS